LRALMSESISSMKITDGCITPATANSVRTCGGRRGAGAGRARADAGADMRLLKASSHLAP
jgi:hypothetical protein